MYHFNRKWTLWLDEEELQHTTSPQKSIIIKPLIYFKYFINYLLLLLTDGVHFLRRHRGIVTSALVASDDLLMSPDLLLLASDLLLMTPDLHQLHRHRHYRLHGLGHHGAVVGQLLATYCGRKQCFHY